MTEKLPLVSIVTVVYNGEKYIEKTINSVLNQTYPNIEYIIVDGGSTDKTLELIASYENEIDLLISEPDEGIYDAMNKGIAICNGDIIGMINSDDWYSEEAIEMVVNKYVESGSSLDVIHSDRFDVYPDSTLKVKKFDSSLFKFKYYGMTYSHPSMFVASNVYRSFKYNTNLKALSDYEFVYRLIQNGKFKFSHIKKPLVYYRLDGLSGNMSMFEHAKEGWLVRRNAGLNFGQRLFSLIFNMSVVVAFRTLRIIKVKRST